MSATNAKTGPSLWDLAVAVAYASAGIAKLLPAEGEKSLFKGWGWSEKDMQIIGAAELLGAALFTTRATKIIGATLLTSTSICVLTNELKHNDNDVATPRTGLLLAALTGFFTR